MEAQTITLTGAQEWADFAAANADALHAECVDLDDACSLARRGELRLGGGSAPLVVVTLEGYAQSEQPRQRVAPDLRSPPPCPECDAELYFARSPDGSDGFWFCDACDWDEGDETPIRPQPYGSGGIAWIKSEREAFETAARVRGYDTHVYYGWNGFWAVALYIGRRRAGTLSRADMYRAGEAWHPLVSGANSVLSASGRPDALQKVIKALRHATDEIAELRMHAAHTGIPINEFRFREGLDALDAAGGGQA